MPSISSTHPEGATGGDLQDGCSAGSKKQRRRRRRKKKKVTYEQVLASNYVHEWAFGGGECSDDAGNELPPSPAGKVVFELHSHSNFSDGFFSPAALVERAHGNGVKVLALTDHDTMAGIPEAMETAHKFNMKIIPGVEISTVYSPGDEGEGEEPLHILAYYGSCGPLMHEEVEGLLANIRDGRYLRAQKMLVKLDKLKMPLKWEDVVSMAGIGVAPGRVHVARAMVEAGYVDNLKQAFSRYLYDGGPAYAKGSEPSADYVVRLICRTGGVATLAHPWALKNPISVIESLKAAGLHALEVYRSDGKLAGFNDLADKHGLLKLGGSDYHGRKADDESDLGSVHLPVLDVFKFLKLALPIWCNATSKISRNYIKNHSSADLRKILGFQELDFANSQDLLDLCLHSWLTNEEERQKTELEIAKLKLSDTAAIINADFSLPLDNRQDPSS